MICLRQSVITGGDWDPGFRNKTCVLSLALECLLLIHGTAMGISLDFMPQWKHLYNRFNSAIAHLAWAPNLIKGTGLSI